MAVDKAEAEADMPFSKAYCIDRGLSIFLFSVKLNLDFWKVVSYNFLVEGIPENPAYTSRTYECETRLFLSLTWRDAHKTSQYSTQFDP